MRMQFGECLQLRYLRECRLGRNTACHPKSRYENLLVSKKHCRVYILRNDNPVKLYVEDTSANGTYLNGVLIPSETTKSLEDGDVITLIVPR